MEPTKTMSTWLFGLTKVKSFWNERHCVVDDLLKCYKNVKIQSISWKMDEKTFSRQKIIKMCGQQKQVFRSKTWMWLIFEKEKHFKNKILITNNRAGVSSVWFKVQPSTPPVPEMWIFDDDKREEMVFVEANVKLL